MLAVTTWPARRYCGLWLCALRNSCHFFFSGILCNDTKSIRLKVLAQTRAVTAQPIVQFVSMRSGKPVSNRHLKPSFIPMQKVVTEKLFGILLEQVFASHSIRIHE